MTVEEFKRRWNSDLEEEQILFDDIAKCAIEWGIDAHPRMHDIYDVRDKVIAFAGCSLD